MPPHRPVLAHHLILTCYGFWLPNDPRGSGSRDVRSAALRRFGPAAHVDNRHSVAHTPHDAVLRQAAKAALKHPPVRLTGTQAHVVAQTAGRYFRSKAMTCLAFAIMPDHLHLIVRQTPTDVRRLALELKAATGTALLKAGQHPYQSDPNSKRPKIWAKGQRVVYLFDDARIRHSIRYVENNPVRAGLRPQHWSFVTAI